MNTKVFTSVVTSVVISVIAIALVGVFVWFNTQHTLPSDTVFCATDVHQCLDGSYVSRTGPECEFADCPFISDADVIASWQTYTNSTYAYQIKFPQNWTVVERETETWLESPEAINPETPEDSGYAFGILFTDQINTSEGSSDLGTIQVSGREATQRMESGPFGDYETTYIPLDTGYLMTYLAFSEVGNRMYDLILSTFQFTD